MWHHTSCTLSSLIPHQAVTLVFSHAASPLFFFLVLPSKTSGPRWWSCAVQLSISGDINVQPHPVVEAELHALFRAVLWDRMKAMHAEVTRFIESLTEFTPNRVSFLGGVLLYEAQLQNAKPTL